jgi:LmbE family N-acetylglucosaminyl deacetylase
MNILAIGCHPDDIEIGCGGTLARCSERGDNITICHVANGNMGHVIIQPDELRNIRAREARRGGEILGAHRVVSLDVPDLTVNSSDRGIVREMIALIRDIDPDFIITHSPDDYMKDHAETSKLAFDASFSATVPHFGTSAATSRFPPIFYMDTLAGVGFQPELYVDISAVIEKKLQALNCHESQVKWMLEHDHIDFTDMVKTCARYRGYQSSAAYAEGFITCKAYPRMPSKPLLP